MSDTYKGDSDGKRFARWTYWNAVRLELGESFSAGKHLFLASRDGADFGVLRAMGLPFHQMVGVDRDDDALTACESRWQGIAPECDAIFQHGEIDQEIGWYEKNEGPVVSAFLDFCCHIDRGTLLTSSNAYLSMRPGSVLGLAFLKGREKIQTTSRVANMGNRAMRRNLMRISKGWHRTLVSMIAGASPWDLNAVLKLVREEEQISDPAEARLSVVHSALLHAGRFRSPLPFGVIEYQSRTKSSQGVPMVIFLFRIGKPGVIPGTHWRIKEPPEVRSLIKEMATTMGSAAGAQAFNLPASTVAAWKAHATRRREMGKAPESA